MGLLADFYYLSEIGQMLGLSYYAVKMRVRRGTYPALMYNGKIAGVSKRDFWRVCAKHESLGLIRVGNMPQEYRDERWKFLGDAVFEDNVLRGREHA